MIQIPIDSFHRVRVAAARHRPAGGGRMGHVDRAGRAAVHHPPPDRPARRRARGRPGAVQRLRGPAAHLRSHRPGHRTQLGRPAIAHRGRPVHHLRPRRALLDRAPARSARPTSTSMAGSRAPRVTPPSPTATTTRPPAPTIKRTSTPRRWPARHGTDLNVTTLLSLPGYFVTPVRPAPGSQSATPTVLFPGDVSTYRLTPDPVPDRFRLAPGRPGAGTSAGSSPSGPATVPVVSGSASALRIGAGHPYRGTAVAAATNDAGVVGPGPDHTPPGHHGGAGPGRRHRGGGAHSGSASVGHPRGGDRRGRRPSPSTAGCSSGSPTPTGPSPGPSAPSGCSTTPTPRDGPSSTASGAAPLPPGAR